MIPLLWRRSALARLLLAVAALALGGASVLGTQLAAAALHYQAERAAQLAAGRAQYDISPFSRPGFSPSEVAAVRKLTAVSEVGLLTSKADLARLPGGGFQQVVLVLDYPQGVALRPLPLLRGSRPGAGMVVAVSQSLSPGFSAATGQGAPGAVGLGGSIELTESRGVGRFRVVGVVADSGPGAPFTGDAVYVDSATALRLFSSGLGVQEIAVRLRPGTTVGALDRELPSALHQDFTVSAARPAGQDPVSELAPVLDAVTALSLLLAVALVGATLSSVVLERRREIGLARLAGASRTLVFRSFIREALAVGLLGGLLGAAAGYALASVLVAISSATSTAPQVGIRFQWEWTLGSVLLTMALALVASLVPAVEAATTRPLEAVRPRSRRGSRAWARAWPLFGLVAALGAAVAFSVGGSWGVALGATLTYAAVLCLLGWQGPRLVGILASLVGGLLSAPAAAVATRARTRPGRTSLALGSLFVSMATAASLAGITSSALLSGNLWVGRLFVGNYLVVGPVVQSSQVEAQLLAAVRRASGHPKVSDVAPIRFVPARAGHLAVTLAATNLPAYAASGALQFVEGQRARALRLAAQGQGAIIPLQLAQALHAGPGSTLDLVASGGRGRFRVAGVVAHTLPGPGGVESVVISRGSAVRDFGSGADGFDLIQLRATGPGAAAAVRLAAFRYGMQPETVAAVRRGVDQGIQNDIALLSAVALVGVVIAVLAAVDTVVLDTREATRELALLRVLGLGRSALGRAVIGQAAATAVLGAALGVGVGVGLVYPEVAAASTPYLPLPFSVSLAPVLAVSVGVVVALALAAVLPARQLARMDPTEALAVE